ncbi:Thiamine-binding protein [uncultured archaeon]|nr:Thiamine-binding protein [uncultured archaeon]
MGAGTSASQYVRAIHDILREDGINFVPGPLSTAIEASSFEQLFKVVERANVLLAEMGIKRVITTVHIDYRIDREISIKSKLDACAVK